MVQKRHIVIVAIVVGDRPGTVPEVQDVLTRFGEMIIGRMGVPHRPRGLHIITVVVDAGADELTAFTQSLQEVAEVQVAVARIELAPENR